MDRFYCVELLLRIALPVLENMSKGELKKQIPIELSPVWDNRPSEVVYMECFGRLMAGIAPWLGLPDDETPEGTERKRVRNLALKSYTHAVDSRSHNYLMWEGHGQPLVDAAYIANSFLRAPKQLWEPLDWVTQQHYIKAFKSLRRITPYYNNWMLFPAMIETFLFSVGEDPDMFRIETAIRKMNEWYIGDGWYSDGEVFAFNYYNSYVIQPMLYEILYVLQERQVFSNATFLQVRQRMQRYSEILERLVSPEAAFPVFGRSATYRTAVFQPLALLAWKEDLPASLPEGQVRNVLVSVMKRLFSVEGNWDEKGFLRLGFAGHQPDIADTYSNNGSMYITSLSLLPLGLPADHSFWTCEPLDWTSKKAWSGQAFAKDRAMNRI